MNDLKFSIPGNQMFVEFYKSKDFGGNGFNAMVLESM